MVDEELLQLRKSLDTAFIDKTVDSNLALKPRFLSNNHLEGEKLLSVIDDELSNCNEFAISVAFITMGGLTPLLQTLRELEKRKIKGRILTTDYLMFSEPEALRRIAQFKNIDLRMYKVQDGPGFHTKGYIFKDDGFYKIIIGSANMTQSALTVNHEWNTMIVSTEKGEMAQDIVKEFETIWNSKNSLSFELFFQEYKTRFDTIKRQRQTAAAEPVIPLDAYKLEPNKMQVAFIDSLKKLEEQGAKKALLISATGTGKTYASAFGIRDALKPHGKVLFVVHRKEILKQALKSYKKVFGSKYKMEMLTGEDKNFEAIDSADILFAMITMLSKDDILKRFGKDHFSVICLDEVHHSTAQSYQKIIDYFMPEFMLGMTATPDRTDEGNVYELFDYNIAYEIRLQQALENDLLCPFHYFGIKDIAFDDADSGDELMKRVEKGDMTVFNLLTRDERVDYVKEQAQYYGFSGNRVKGLIFCSSVKEAIALSEKFNERGLRTIALTGNNNSESRQEAIERLASDDRDDYLDYILTVDIFNEGVDIPEINQVIMLRPTESAIVFIQQLGRGLRKMNGKEYLVILDFIGNFNNNFLIPIALSGDRTYNKDNLRKYILEGSSIIPGCSSIHFDEISKKKIFESIDKASTPLKFLKEKYTNLKERLGRMPTMSEFYHYGEIDPILFVDYKNTSYYDFVRRIDKDANIPRLTQAQENALSFVSTQIINGKRLHEIRMIQLLLEKQSVSYTSFSRAMLTYGVKLRKEDYQSAKRVLTKDFLNSPSDKSNYGGKDIVRTINDSIVPAPVLTGDKESFFLKALSDVIEYGLSRYSDYYSETDEDNLVLYQKYSRKDVCRILNWDKDDSSTVYGYRIKNGTCPIFVTYEKKEDISETTKYEDQFIDTHLFSWMTRSRVTIESSEAQEIINYRDNGLKIFLFIKKSDGEGTDFYYMGRAIPVSYQQTTISDKNGKNIPIVNFKLKLEKTVRNDIYDYLTK
ncbi:Helicase conserved C-terminal domain-containing protein [Ruminococcaceae bacterium YAD3003]|nr:Helicase conserved C-terminal domain-containing protein [Ruminococcaceae bacterium YAD3003]